MNETTQQRQQQYIYFAAHEARRWNASGTRDHRSYIIGCDKLGHQWNAEKKEDDERINLSITPPPSLSYIMHTYLSSSTASLTSPDEPNCSSSASVSFGNCFSNNGIFSYNNCDAFAKSPFLSATRNNDNV